MYKKIFHENTYLDDDFALYPIGMGSTRKLLILKLEFAGLSFLCEEFDARTTGYQKSHRGQRRFALP